MEVYYLFCLVFFFKQKTAYEMRISDWSSDVCSSDLYAADIRESGQHLLGIINDILDLSKVEAGKETLHEQDIAFEAVVSGTRLLVEGRAREAGVNLVFDCAAVLPGVRADKRRLIQILVNLDRKSVG